MTSATTTTPVIAVDVVALYARYVYGSRENLAA
jgi:hypothetical protein